MIARAAVLCLIAACGKAPPVTTSPAPPPTPPANPDPAPAPAADLTQLGEPCDDAKPCTAPTTCVTYYGIAGARGPAFKSCEITCGDGPDACPAGTTCITIADGPGAVCRRGDR